MVNPVTIMTTRVETNIIIKRGVAMYPLSYQIHLLFLRLQVQRIRLNVPIIYWLSFLFFSTLIILVISKNNNIIIPSTVPGIGILVFLLNNLS